MPLSQSKVQQTTNEGAPWWASSSPIPTAVGSAGGQQSAQDVASVIPGQAQISVEQPSQYTKPVAAHEATHVFQGSRNGDFQRQSQSLLPAGAQSAKDYQYSGLNDPRKSIGNFNPEQQAQMVEDLTSAQANLSPKMSPKALQQWDATKTTLERPIRQMMAVPPQDASLAGRADNWIADRPLGKFLDHPFTRLAGQFSAPKMTATPQPPPEAPSVALGYANRSKLVR